MSSAPRILLTRQWPESVEQVLQKSFDVTLNTSDKPMSSAELNRAFDHYDIICPTVSDKIDAEIIGNEMRRTRLLVNFGVGVDHIDVDHCANVGISVTNTPGVLTDATADLALTLILMAARRAGEGEREVRSQRWTGWRPTHLLGASLADKTLGLVGFGRIGLEIARRAHHGFRMNIRYFSRSAIEPELAEELRAERVEHLDDLLACADVISLNVPGGPATHHMVGANELAKVKPGAILVNTARGTVIDHDALANSLINGPLFAAGLDVFPEEPKVPQALLALENVVLLPHLGSATKETREAMGMRAVANIQAFTEGSKLPDAL